MNVHLWEPWPNTDAIHSKAKTSASTRAADIGHVSRWLVRSQCDCSGVSVPS